MSSTRFFNRPLRAVAAMAAACAMSLPALAIPTLQLDIGGGTYNSSTTPTATCSAQTTCAGSQSFTLYALFTPSSRAPSPSDTYYISAAVEPGLSAPANLGSFTFNSTVVNVTSGMTLGTPSGLPPHDAFPTYFKEFTFSFSPADGSAVPYDVQTVAGTHTGPTGGPGAMLYRAFTVDTTNLSSQVRIHFDLYHRDGSRIDERAPFSHDAESVPAPAVLSLLGLGLMLAGALRSRARS